MRRSRGSSTSGARPTPGRMSGSTRTDRSTWSSSGSVARLSGPEGACRLPAPIDLRGQGKTMPEIKRASWHAVRGDRMRILSTLKRLAMRPPSPWPVLSVYVNTRPVGTQIPTYRPYLKKRMAEELRSLKARSPEHESLAVDFARAQHYLDYDLRDVTQAVAIFASYAGEDLFDTVQLPVEFAENQVVVGPMPLLFPLLRVADRYRRAAVAVADGTATRLFVVALGAVEIRREVRAPAARENGAEASASSLATQSARALE